MEAHGGYIFRTQGAFQPQKLVPLAIAALTKDGQSNADCSLQLSVLPALCIVRLAYDAPFAYGRKGAHWYRRRHALAEALSKELGVTVHAYVLDPLELEQVTTYGDGHAVGGERLVYEEVEVDEEDLLDATAYERLKDKWPMGRLARILGARRTDLVKLPRAQTALIHLDGREAESGVHPLWPIQKTA